MLSSKLTVLLLVLGVSGIVYAAPDCSYAAEQKCGQLNKDDWKGKTWPVNSIELDKACRSVGSSIDCQIAFAERCPRSLLSVFLDYMRESKKVYRRLCTKLDDFRMKFLKNVSCLNENVTKLFNTCTPAFAGKFGDLCEKNTATLKCVVEGVSRKCGSESRQVFDTLYKPKLAMDKIFCRKSVEMN